MKPDDTYQHIMEVSDLQQKVQYLLESGYRLIWVDECVYTRTTIATKTWKRSETTVMYKNKSLNIGSIAMIAGVSMEYGLEYYELHDYSINRWIYRDFLD
jgi:hypothetical protein